MIADDCLASSATAASVGGQAAASEVDLRQAPRVPSQDRKILNETVWVELIAPS